MHLIRLIYASTFDSEKFSPDEIAQIHKTSEKNNGPKEITGMLVFGNDFFLQCLEGGSIIVNELYAKITNDPRHKKPLLLSYEDCYVREFPDWEMKLILMTKEKRHLVRQFSTTGEFNPYLLRVESALRLLMALRDLSR